MALRLKSHECSAILLAFSLGLESPCSRMMCPTVGDVSPLAAADHFLLARFTQNVQIGTNSVLDTESSTYL